MFFKGIETLDELKREYRRLTKKYHPDVGGDTETMKKINNEYSEMFEILKRRHNAAADENHQTTECPEEFIQIINELLHMDGLEVELCGSWIWIGGNTKQHKEKLKAVGCMWSSKKKLWYWRHPEDGRQGRHKSRDMAYIRMRYGSQTFSKDGREERRGGARLAAAV